MSNQTTKRARQPIFTTRKFKERSEAPHRAPKPMNEHHEMLIILGKEVERNFALRASS